MPLLGKHPILSSAAAPAALLLIGIILSPRYLVYSDLPQKSNIIVNGSAGSE